MPGPVGAASTGGEALVRRYLRQDDLKASAMATQMEMMKIVSSGVSMQPT
jgi:hypothetical protein